MDLKDKRVLVTGGSLGIGKATASLLVESGATVAITGRDEARIEAAGREIGAVAIAGDVSVEADVDRCYQTVLERMGGLDVLINNAGIGIHQPLLELAPADIERVWRVNVLGAAMMAKRAAAIFVEQNHGNIVNISSTSGLKGYETGTAYVGSKFALRGMTECWRAELRRHNVRVILINPSEVATAFGNPQREERAPEPNKLTSMEIAHAIQAALEMDDRGFIPELSVFATNPWD